MHRRRLPQAEVSTLITELRQAGATQIRRVPADAKGLVEVRWADAELEREQYAADLRAWRLPMILSGLVVAIIIAVLLIAG